MTSTAVPSDIYQIQVKFHYSFLKVPALMPTLTEIFLACYLVQQYLLI